eukprot:COSAG02_NODE_9240_length_2279_cov_6.101346_1_plen_221_part_10
MATKRAVMTAAALGIVLLGYAAEGTRSCGCNSTLTFGNSRSGLNELLCVLTNETHNVDADFVDLAEISWSVLSFARTIVLTTCAAGTLAATMYTVFAVVPQLVCDSDTRFSCARAFSDLAAFYCALYHYVVRGGAYPAPYFGDSIRAQCQVYSLALVYRMWAQPHYRNGDFREDMAKNLRNVAIPGTGIPLSVLCYFKPLAVLFLIIGYPLAALVAALNMH